MSITNQAGNRAPVTVVGLMTWDVGRDMDMDMGHDVDVLTEICK